MVIIITCEFTCVKISGFDFFFKTLSGWICAPCSVLDFQVMLLSASKNCLVQVKYVMLTCYDIGAGAAVLASQYIKTNRILEPEIINLNLM